VCKVGDEAFLRWVGCEAEIAGSGQWNRLAVDRKRREVRWGGLGLGDRGMDLIRQID
jgi:hypothetical protein